MPKLAVPEEVAETIRQWLEGVGPPPVPPSSVEGAVLSVPPEMFPAQGVPRFILTVILGLPDAGAWREKLAWEIDFEFRGTPMVLSYEKFGIRLRLWAAQDDREAVATEFLAALKKAVAYLDREVLLPTADAALGHGDVTIGNRYHQLREQYEYFRTMVDECLEGRGRWMSDPNGTLRLAAPQQEGFINLTAAVNAYFSWLEHVLVLALPFADFDPSSDDLRRIIGSNWRSKFRRLFSPGDNPTANRHLSKLVELAEDTRNPWAHGAFDKGGGLLYLHIPDIGAIPMNVSQFDKSVHFGGVMGLATDFDATWQTLDEVDRYLREAPQSRYGVTYAESGLQVRFDDEARSQYVDAMTSDEVFARFIDDTATWRDRHQNMDW